MSRLRVLAALVPLLALVVGAATLETPTESAKAEGVCVTHFKLPRAAGGLARGADGRLWFTEQLNDRIGVFDPDTRRV